MRLINIDTLELEEFVGRELPPYFILSHTWSDDEISYQEYLWLQNHAEEAKLGILDEFPPRQRARLEAKNTALRGRSGFSKITSFVGLCKRIRDEAIIAKRPDRERASYAWVDTCCINKESSAELSEAINTMYKWYWDAHRCIAYLNDVDDTDYESHGFRRTRWFTRGWTLQELLAPDELEFYNRNWNYMTTKSKAASAIQRITGISSMAFRNRAYVDSNSRCVAERMSWAANRKTTRVEDEAYCLIGIFKVNMPLLYGEGDRAFQRLQQQIIANYDDQTIFAWGFGQPVTLIPSFEGVLAPSPSSFSHGVQRADRDMPFCPWNNLLETPYSMANVGLSITVPLFRLPIVANGVIRTYALLPAYLCGEYAICMPLCPTSHHEAPLEDVPDGAVFYRPRLESPIPLLREDEFGAVQFVRKSIVISSQRPSHGLRTKSFSSPYFSIFVSFSGGLGFIEAWSASASTYPIIQKKVRLFGSVETHQRAWHPAFFLFQKRLEDGGKKEYLVALLVDRDCQTVLWARVFSWRETLLSNKIYQDHISLAALFRAVPRLTEREAWSKDAIPRDDQIQILTKIQEDSRGSKVIFLNLT
ncbi:hypothetical protein QBC47DRAFT_186046 [Echria macrotheca]|uniref:Heterokaryon incompatibility domain-containing protein n=1 Tax=Echria macrotheca TaxID=438768 RepID=A0AAJ0BG00_9PEZI|nr:hypothetical protein QBC47DRAFT_186046 [Echria macrotheca]